MMLLGFEPGTVLVVAIVSCLAFVVRGLTGFGSAMLGIGGLTMLLPPAQVVPAFLALEVLTTAHLVPQLWRQVRWRTLPWLLAGSVLATPFGTLLLAHLSPDRMRLLLSTCLLGLALLMMRSGAARWIAGRLTPRAGALGVGAASVLLNGAVGVSGPPVIVYYFATSSAAVSRASLIAYFLVTDVYALSLAAGNGLLQGSVMARAGIALPPALLGIWAGSRLHVRLDESLMQRVVWLLLALIGLAGCSTALWRFI